MSKCAKCSYEDEDVKEKFNTFLCKICHAFSPEKEQDFKDYVSEKMPFANLEPLRKHVKNLSEPNKVGMERKASQGELMSRPAFGYILDKGKLVPAQNYKEVEEIFEEFLNSSISLRQLAQKHNFSVNGLKKILRNFTYIGKIKFNGIVHQGNHQPIVSSTLFNHVQNKLENLGIKR